MSSAPSVTGMTSSVAESSTAAAGSATGGSGGEPSAAGTGQLAQASQAPVEVMLRPQSLMNQ